jgi:hypothetical protein
MPKFVTTVELSVVSGLRKERVCSWNSKLVVEPLTFHADVTTLNTNYTRQSICKLCRGALWRLDKEKGYYYVKLKSVMKRIITIQPYNNVSSLRSSTHVHVNAGSTLP